MVRKLLLNRAFIQNLMWFFASLVLAFFVWMIAIAETDPIQEKLFTQIPVLIEPNAGLLITNSSSSTVRVKVRAQQSVLDSLTKDDITVRAALSNIGEGTHVVELQTRVTRRAITDTQPAQITVTLEKLEAKKVPVVALIAQQPQVEFEIIDLPTFDQNQVQVSGPASKVQQIVAAQVALDLSQQRSDLEQESALVPVGADGTPIEGVTLDPPTVQVSINIRQRADISQVPVRPNILFDTLPEGYFLSSITYDPQTVLLSGSQRQLESLSSTLFTEPIDLTDRTTDFETKVGVVLPDKNLLILDGQTITVSVGITAPTANRQFDNVPVDVIGLGEGLTTQLTPQEVTVLITGPRPALENLEVDDIQVVVDLNGMTAGNYEAVLLRVLINQLNIGTENISVLPANVDVVIKSLAETTPEPPPGP